MKYFGTRSERNGEELRVKQKTKTTDTNSCRNLNSILMCQCQCQLWAKRTPKSKLRAFSELGLGPNGGAGVTVLQIITVESAELGQCLSLMQATREESGRVRWTRPTTIMGIGQLLVPTSQAYRAKGKRGYSII